MFKDYQIFDNFFKDPDKVADRCNDFTYFPSNSNVAWTGLRTKWLKEIDQELFYSTFDNLFPNIFSKNTNLDCVVQACAHLITEEYVHSKEWFHTDDSLLAGVIYLTKNPKPNSGTTLLLDNGTLTVENKYNRCIVYNAKISHAAQGGFGKDLSYCRKTISFFIDSIGETK